MSAHTRRAGKTVAAGVTLVAAVGLATLAAIFFRGGGTGSGAGSGTGPAEGAGTGSNATPASFAAQPETRPAPEAAADVTPQRPLKITVRESTYLVNGREVSLQEIGELAAKVPEGPGVAVVVERDASSRAKAEDELRNALKERDIDPAWD